MLKNDLPIIYQEILSKDFLELAPQEKLATCTSCYKTQKNAPLPHFDSNLKCCTYYPFIPNYLVGAILSSQNLTAEGANIIRDLIRERRYVLPIGLCPPPSYQALFNAKRAEDYGNRFDLLCPFYNNKKGGCNIWPYRGHECATYFCHSSYGMNGEKFWQEVRTSLFELEMYLSQLAMLELGFHNKEIDTNLSYIKNEQHLEGQGWSVSAVEWSKLWAHHFEDIEEYYIRTLEFVKTRAAELKVGWYENRYITGSAHSRFLETLIMGREVPKDHSNR